MLTLKNGKLFFFFLNNTNFQLSYTKHDRNKLTMKSKPSSIKTELQIIFLKNI